MKINQQYNLIYQLERFTSFSTLKESTEKRVYDTFA